MEKSTPGTENIVKDIRNVFRLKEELNYTVNKNIRNCFR